MNVKPFFPIWMVGSCVLMLIGAVGPWAKSPIDTLGGLEAAGALVMILGVPALACCALLLLTPKRPRPRWALIVAFVAAVLCALMALYNWSVGKDILDSPLAAGSGVSLQWGLYLCALASVSFVLACIAGFVMRGREAPAAAAPAE